MDNSSAEEILEMLKKNNIYSLWHFTDIGNLGYIKKLNGLRSKEFLQNKVGLKNIICGGDELSHRLDKKWGNCDKIHLSFTPYTPMAYNTKKEKDPIFGEKELVFIEIDIIVATFDDVYFTDSNATSNDHKRKKGIEGLRNVKFEYINMNPNPNDPNWKKYVQAEVLVPNHIPLDYFKRIHFKNEASLRLGESLWEGYHPPFVVNSKIFLLIEKYKENKIRL